MELGGRPLVIAILCASLLCTCVVSRSCSDRQFSCKDGKQCIPSSWRCDNAPDCRDHSDELNCQYKPCGKNEVRCKSEKCISEADQCDGFDDCPDGEDELNCTHCNNATEFQCNRGLVKCVPQTKVCDGHFDCQDYSDEKVELCNKRKIVAVKQCRSDEFNCTGGGCISLTLKCDGKEDCKDGSDEKGCKPSDKCPTGEFRCRSGTPKCIPMIRKCDSFDDCSDKSDEHGCQSVYGDIDTCPLKTDFSCGYPSSCITASWRCDGEPDCPNAADERNCAATTCPPPKIACNQGNKCLHPSQKCDGIKDCRDGSDESNCPSLKKRDACIGKFPCGSVQKNGCVDWDKVCTNKMECPDGEDERPGGDASNCKLNPCKLMNGGCTHTCVNRYTYSYCECPKGLKLSSDNATCEDVNECEIWGSCSQKCENIKGGYKCSCEMGYSVDSKNKSRCIANGEEKSLLLATQQKIRQYSLKKGYEERVIVSDLVNVIGLDYDLHSKPPRIFWTQPTPPALYMSTFGESKSSHNDELFSERKSIPGGLAYDWIHKLLYMSDTGLKGITVLNISSPTTGISVIATGDIEEPRAIVVDPSEGWLYWTDWGRSAKISKIGMNGQYRKVLVDTKIVLPNALAMDLPTRRLYWCDAKLHTISTIDLDGNDRRLVYSHYDIYPFSMSVFEDEIYWSDWHYESVMSVNKFHATNHKTLFDKHHVSGIRVVHALMQPNIPSRCNNHHCSHFCLPAPKIGGLKNDYSCACPEKYILLDDDRTCVKNTSPKLSRGKTTTIPMISDKLSGTTGTTSTELSTYPDVVSTSTTTPKGRSQTVPPRGKNLPSIGKNSTSKNTTVLYKEERVGHVAGIAIGVILLVFAMVAVIMLLLYRVYSRKNIRSMNFDNPVYRKANAECDGDTEAQYPMNDPNAPHTRALQTRAPIWTGGVTNDAVEA